MSNSKHRNGQGGGWHCTFFRVCQVSHGPPLKLNWLPWQQFFLCEFWIINFCLKKKKKPFPEQLDTKFFCCSGGNISSTHHRTYGLLHRRLGEHSLYLYMWSWCPAGVSALHMAIPWFQTHVSKSTATGADGWPAFICDWLVNNRSRHKVHQGMLCNHNLFLYLGDRPVFFCYWVMFRLINAMFIETFLEQRSTEVTNTDWDYITVTIIMRVKWVSWFVCEDHNVCCMKTVQYDVNTVFREIKCQWRSIIFVFKELKPVIQLPEWLRTFINNICFNSNNYFPVWWNISPSLTEAVCQCSSRGFNSSV